MATAEALMTAEEFGLLGGLHTLGDHAQTSFVIDGQPISDQQSKVFSTQLPTSAIESMEVTTGTPDAEFGDKSSLVAQITTRSGLGAGRLFGNVDKEMLQSFFAQLDAARDAPGPLLLEMTTEGGEADIGRRMALEVRLLREARAGRDGDDARVCFLGKTIVYSAGVTVMSAFPAADRWLTRDTVLLIHERKLDKTVHFAGPLRAVLAVARDLVAELENGERLERDGFADLVRGSDVGMDELMGHALTANWYVDAAEALGRGLVTGLV